MERAHKLFILCCTILSYQTLKSFKTNSATQLTKLFKIYGYPKLEYNTQIWSPFSQKDIKKKLSLCKGILPC